MRRGSAALLVLPDGRVVLQRRTEDAPRAPGLLGLFGGQMEEGETPESVVRRELGEETSLPCAELTYEHQADITVPATESESGQSFQTSLYLVRIPSAEFEVYEGQRAEAYNLDELRARADLTSITRHSLSKVFGGAYGTKHHRP